MGFNGLSHKHSQRLTEDPPEIIRPVQNSIEKSLIL